MIRSALFLAGLLLTGQISEAFDLAKFARDQGLPVYTIDIVRVIPHLTSSFTQGLLYHNGALYESTGRYQMSLLEKLDPATGNVLKAASLPADLFGEGLALYNNRLLQITWLEHTALVYDIETFEQVGQYRYNGEGWGLTTWGNTLIMSDGSSTLSKRNAVNFDLEATLPVTIAGQKLSMLNELEMADSRLFANLLGMDYLVEINPESGEVKAVVDATSLRDRIGEPIEEIPLNGIAYDSATGDFFLTGKLWPAIFRVKFVRDIGK